MNNNYNNNQSSNMKFTYQDYLKNKQQNPINNNNDNPYAKDEFSFGKPDPHIRNLVYSQTQNQFQNYNNPNDQNKSHL